MNNELALSSTTSSLSRDDKQNVTEVDGAITSSNFHNSGDRDQSKASKQARLFVHQKQGDKFSLTSEKITSHAKSRRAELNLDLSVSRQIFHARDETS
jgi:hypothetical protein